MKIMKTLNRRMIISPERFSQLRKRLLDDKGWTFVETLIVIAIALMLTAMVGLTAFKQVGKAKRVKAQTEIENAALALTTYYLDCGSYPTEQQGLDSLWAEPTSDPQPDGWNGPYITREIDLDPWGKEYVYMNPGQSGQPFGIMSYGSDGVERGEGEAEDITSW
jgi:general secretion pathway protein G